MTERYHEIVTEILSPPDGAIFLTVSHITYTVLAGT